MEMSREAGAVAFVATRGFAQIIFAVFLIVGLVRPSFADSAPFGAYGPEGVRMREQFWIVPSGDQERSLRATVFRPADTPGVKNERRQLVIINHGTDEFTRQSVAMPVYFWLSKWFVDRGYVVIIPQRRGHGATGGDLSESIGSCDTTDHYLSGQIAADDIESTLSYMTQQPFVQPGNVIVVGVSTGGWASLALASRNLPQVEAIVNFAGGRGGHAYGRRNQICNSAGLEMSARLFGASARTPSLWLYSENDSYFGPDLAARLAAAWQSGGGRAETHILPPYSSDGHSIADDRAGAELWGATLDAFLASAAAQSAPQSASQDISMDHPSAIATSSTAVSHAAGSQ